MSVEVGDRLGDSRARDGALVVILRALADGEWSADAVTLTAVRKLAARIELDLAIEGRDREMAA